MEASPSVIPSWQDTDGEDRRRTLVHWGLITLAVVIVALLAWRVASPGSTPAATATPAPSAAADPDPTPTASPTQVPRATPVPVFIPPVGTLAPSAAPSPAATGVPAATATVAHMTGVFTTAAPPTCAGGGMGAPGPPAECRWTLTAPPGASVTFNLTWPEEAGLQLTVLAPPGTGKPLYTNRSTGPMTATLHDMPAKSLIVISRPGGTGTSTFDLKVTMAAQ
jgi:hypothetical protein